MCLRKIRSFLDDRGEPFTCVVQVSFPHGRGRLAESLINVRAVLSRCKICSPRNEADPEHGLADQDPTAHGKALAQAGRNQLIKRSTQRDMHIRILYLAANPGECSTKIESSCLGTKQKNPCRNVANLRTGSVGLSVSGVSH